MADNHDERTRGSLDPEADEAARGEAAHGEAGPDAVGRDADDGFGRGPERVIAMGAGAPPGPGDPAEPRRDAAAVRRDAASTRRDAAATRRDEAAPRRTEAEVDFTAADITAPDRTEVDIEASDLTAADDGEETDRFARRSSRNSIRRAMEEAALAAAARAAREAEKAESASQEFSASDARPAPGVQRNDGAGEGGDAARKAGGPPAERQGQALARLDGGKLPATRETPEIALVDEAGFEQARLAREARMRDIRSELRRRRRFRALGMVLRFAVFVLIPTAFVGWYYYEKATDMFVSDSSMIFKTGSNQSAGSGLLGALVGTSPTDSVALQEYILSRDILRRLDQDHGVIAHFQSEEIDWWHRLPADASFDDAYSYYAGGFIMPGKVTVSYDIAEGIVRLEMIAATPDKAQEFSEAIIGYGEELVNSLNDRSRNAGVRAADEKVLEAQEALRDAQRKVADVQEQLSIFSVESEAGALQTRIVTAEAEIDALLAQIANLKTITSNDADSRFIPLRTQLEIKTEQLRELRGRLTGGGQTAAQDGPSMARLGAELELARLDQMAANMMYTSALTSREAALALAAEQSLFLEVVTQPTLPDEATKPERAQNTGLVFLILFAAYVIGLLTVSLIREQAAI